MGSLRYQHASSKNFIRKMETIQFINCANVSLRSFRFGPLIWRTSKERKKLNKAARNAKCNSGDSGIQIEVCMRIFF